MRRRRHRGDRRWVAGSSGRCLVASSAGRRGYALLVVLGAIAMGLAASFALSRSQTTWARLARNAERAQLAREAAESGAADGVRRMHGASWEGVGSRFSGVLDRNAGGTLLYEVVYEAGHLGWAAELQPWLVTVTASGSFEPRDGSRPSTYEVEVVCGLVRRAVGVNPAGVSELLSHTLWTFGDGERNDTALGLDPGVRVEGSTVAAGVLALFESPAWPSSARARLLSDMGLDLTWPLGGRRAVDRRPLSGPVALWNTSGPIETELRGMSVPVTVMSGAPVAPTWSNTAFLEYSLYEGGPRYEAEVIAQDRLGVGFASRLELGPDPETNPAGVFYREGNLELDDNVRVTGSLIVTGELRLTGRDVELVPVSLPALEGESEPVQLPALQARSIRLLGDAEVVVRGAVLVAGEVRREDATELLVEGHLLAETAALGPSPAWNLPSATWSRIWESFRFWEAAQLAIGFPRPRFTDYLTWWGFSFQPDVLLRSAPSPARVRWEPPVYVPLGTDGGYRWEVLSWRSVDGRA